MREIGTEGIQKGFLTFVPSISVFVERNGPVEVEVLFESGKKLKSTKLIDLYLTDFNKTKLFPGEQ